TRTFPLEKDKATFYIGTDRPADLEALRRTFLAADGPLPISGEYMSSHAFDLATEYGKDTYVSLKHAGSRTLVRMFALKSWANGVFAKVPGLGPSVADAISQKLFALVPEKIPTRLRQYRDRFDHHLLLVASGSQRHAERLRGGQRRQPLLRHAPKRCLGDGHLRCGPASGRAGLARGAAPAHRRSAAGECLFRALLLPCAAPGPCGQEGSGPGRA